VVRSARASDGRLDVSPGDLLRERGRRQPVYPGKLGGGSGLDFDGRGGSELVGGPDVLADLTRLGLARKVPRLSNRAGGYVALRPDLGLRAILDRPQDHLITGFRALMDGVGYLADLQPTIIDPATTPGQLVQVLTDSDEISRVSAGLITDTREQWMTMETMHTEMPLTEDAICECPPGLRGRITMRTIYDKAFTAAPNGRRIIERCTSEGEHARVLPELPMKLKLADTSVALLPLTMTGLSGAILVRADPILKAIREFFEILWERATPYGATPRSAGGMPLSDQERVILSLLAQGYSDDGVARQAGISTTTARRYITKIKKDLNAGNRFQADAAAQGRGWLGQP
jgi:DNA-binding CsgD family transcriptional regulator